MLQHFAHLYQVPEIRKRIFVTIALLMVYRIGWNIPIPGIDPAKVAEMMKQGGGGDNPLVSFLNVISGGGLQRASLFSLGIMPYISASIIFSLLVKVIPALEKVSKEGSAGQRKIGQWTRYATVPICLVQAFFAVRPYTQPVDALRGSEFGFTPITFDSVPFGWMFWAVIGLTAGTIFLMWVGEQITEYGVGNGISILIMAGIVARLPQNFFSANLGTAKTVLMIFTFVLVTLGVVFITKGQRKIPVQYAKLTRGRRVYGGQRHYMPIKVNMAGVMPVIFASALLAFPPIIFNAVGLSGLADALAYGKYLWTMAYVGLTFFFSFFWVALMFNPVEMSKNMKESGSFVPGIRPGRPTAEYLEKIMNRITLAGSFFLAMIAVLPVVLADTMELPLMLTTYIGGTTILIVVSVALDLVDKINSYLVMRNYEGFMGGSKGGKKDK